MDRVLTFFDPSRNQDSSSYQLNKSLVAVGSGEIIGRGFGQTLGGGRSGLILDLANSLLEYRQGSLLDLVSLSELEKLLLQSLNVGVRCCLQQGRR